MIAGQSLSQKALWEIAFQVSKVVDILAATEPSKRFDRGEPGGRAGVDPRIAPGSAARLKALGWPSRDCKPDCPTCHGELMDGSLCLNCGGWGKRLRPSEPSAEAQIQPPDFVGKLISAELHYTNPAVPPGLVRVTLDVTDAEYERLLDSQRAKQSEPSTEDSTQPKGELIT